MSSARKPTGAFQQHYDKIALVAVLAVLLISAVLLIVKLGQGTQRIETSQEELYTSSPIPVEPIDTAILNELAESMSNPYQLASGKRRMLVGDLRVSSIPDGLPIPFDAEVCPFTGAPQPKVVSMDERDTDGDGMADVWEELHGLKPFDFTDGQLDADGDGFSNLEEYLAGTDPNDASIAPPPPAKLRLVRIQIIPFKLRFLGISKLPDGDRYQLNLRTLEKTYFARMNEEIEGYTVVGYEENGADGPVLLLQRADKIIRLTQNRVVDEQARNALMVFLVDGRRYRAIIGESISLQGTDYKVVDIRDDRVVIRDEQAERDIEIGPLSDGERARLGGGTRSATGL